MKLINAIARQRAVNAAIRHLYDHIDSLPTPAREKALNYQRKILIESGSEGESYGPAIISNLKELGSKLD